MVPIDLNAVTVSFSFHTNNLRRKPLFRERERRNFKINF